MLPSTDQDTSVCSAYQDKPDTALPQVSVYMRVDVTMRVGNTVHMIYNDYTDHIREDFNISNVSLMF